MAENFRTERSALDVLQGRLPLQLAGRRFVLPVLSTGQNREWQSSLDAPLDPLIDSKAKLTTVLEALEKIDMLGLIYSYDLSDVLPPRPEIEDDVYPHELLKGVFEIRLATNPTIAYALAATTEETVSQLRSPRPIPTPAARQAPSGPTKRSRRRTAGPTARSATS